MFHLFDGTALAIRLKALSYAEPTRPSLSSNHAYA